LGRAALRSATRFLCFAAACFGVLTAPEAFGGAERYDYDALGRLVRVIDELGRVREFVYDAAGNLLRVTDGGVAQAPAVSAIAPASSRRNRVVQIQISGSGLSGVSVVSDDPGIDISGAAVSATSISFRAAVSSDARLGTHAFSLRNAAGTVSAAFEVVPAIIYAVSPVPLAVPPDSVARAFTIELSEPDTAPLSLTASTLNAAVARVGTATIAVPAGATTATGSITGIAAGSTTLLLTAPTLVEAIAVPIGVTTDYSAATVARARATGLVKGDPTTPAADTPSRALTSVVGLVKGDPTVPAANTPSIVMVPSIGLVKGDPTAPAANTPSNVLTPAVGVTK
jgi:YD repeat-containing protein